MKPHPCDCKEYNGGQCYNCLNGAHSHCRACGRKDDKHLGLMLVFRQAGKTAAAGRMLKRRKK